MLTPPAEVLLSYFTGLAPVGDTVEVALADLTADLGYHQVNSYYRYLRELMAARCIRRLAAGRKGLSGVFVVTWRLEVLPQRHLPPSRMPLEPVHHPRAERTIVKCHRAPRDTRGLTAQLFGDPVFERSALAAKVSASAHLPQFQTLEKVP